MPVKPLAWLLVAQVLLGGALVAWALGGFPLPSVLRGGQELPTATASATTATSTQDAEPTQATPAAGATPTVPRPTRDRFNEARAFALLKRQVTEYGPRPAGSAASRRLAVTLRRLLPNGRFVAIPGHPKLRNIVGRLPGRSPAILVGAHYDTEATVPNHVGANDGAAGTAAVVEIARALRAMRTRGREVQFVLFDGEEEPKGSTDFFSDGLRGSRAYADRYAAGIGDMVLLDYIAERDAPRYPREGGSDPVLWEQLRVSARAVGVGALFPDEVSGEIIDDHTPFALAGVRAIDVIDFDYPVRDTPEDNLDAVSRASLDATGEAVVELLRRLRR